MSKIGIIGAMEEEVKNLYESMDNKHSEQKGVWTFYIGTLNGAEVVIVKSGIGKVNMAACAQKIIDCYDVDFLINTGVAGSLNAKIDIGDIVVSTDLVQHDMDAVAFGYKLGQIPQMDKFSFEADARAIQLAVKLCKEVNPEIGTHTGRVLSGDVFVASKEKKDFLKSEFAGDCTEMEGASMAQVAYINNVPFLVLRAISDKADDSASVSYDQFEMGAIKHLVKLVTAFVKEY